MSDFARNFQSYYVQREQIYQELRNLLQDKNSLNEMLEDGFRKIHGNDIIMQRLIATKEQFFKDIIAYIEFCATPQNPITTESLRFNCLKECYAESKDNTEIETFTPTYKLFKNLEVCENIWGDNFEVRHEGNLSALLWGLNNQSRAEFDYEEERYSEKNRIVNDKIRVEQLERLDRISLSNFQEVKDFRTYGGFGVVHIVENKQGKRLAMKLLNATKSASHTELEGVLTYRDRVKDFSHLIKVYEAGLEFQDESSGQSPYFLYTMDAADDAFSLAHPQYAGYCPVTVGGLLKNYKRLEVEECWHLAKALLEGVKALHEVGLVHRDIKPDNIIFVNGQPKIADVGLVAPIGSSSGVAGTSGFLPPELLEQKKAGRAIIADPRQDLYAVGMTIYCALSGFSPEKMPAITQDLLKDKRAMKLGANMVFKACAKNPEERFQTADEFLAALS